MRIKEVEVSVEATINTGNFSNIKPGYRVVVELGEDENPNVAAEKAERTVDRWLNERIKAIQDDL